MKRIFAVLLALSLLLLAACSKGVSPTEPSPTEPATQAPTEPATEAPTEPSQTEPATEPSQPTEEEGPFTVTYAHAQADTHGSGEVWVQLLAEVTNTGSEPLTLGAADWTVCTPDGTELAVRKGVSAYPQTIEPGEKGWYYDEFTVDTAQTGELAVQYDGDALAASIRAAEQSGVRYAVSDVNLKDSVYGGVELTGRIRNDTAERGSLVCVAAVLLDESEKPLGVVYTVLGSPLEAGAETTFGMSSEMLPPEVKSADIAQVETFAYPLAG